MYMCMPDVKQIYIVYNTFYLLEGEGKGAGGGIEEGGKNLKPTAH